MDSVTANALRMEFHKRGVFRNKTCSKELLKRKPNKGYQEHSLGNGCGQHMF